MKKHIIIAGVPRAGKSTLCQYISSKCGYQHISMDSIIAGIEKVFPETGIDSDADMDVKTKVSGISAKIAPFIQSMIDSGEYDECDYGMVIDVYQLLPGDYVRFIDSEKCDIVYLVTADTSVKERMKLMQRYDLPKDYTYRASEIKLEKLSAEIVAMSKYYQMECQTHNLPCFDTISDRERVFEKMVEWCMHVYKFETPRLRFRELTTYDYDAVASVLLDKETAEAMELVTDEKFVRAWLERTIQRYASVGYSHWYVELKETGDFVGIIGIVPEMVEDKAYIGLGYLVKREFQRQGIALEGARACVDWAFRELHVEQVVAEIAQSNLPSISLVEKLGMNRVKTYMRQQAGCESAYCLYQITGLSDKIDSE